MKTTKKLLCTLLVALLVLASAPIGVIDFGIMASAEGEVATSGQCGDNAYWDFNTETGVLTVSGTGDMWDGGLGFDSHYGSAYYDTPVRSVVIENGITSIGKSNFDYCTLLKSATIADSVTKIGDEAFECCASLTDIKLPKDLKYIGSIAFAVCALESVEIPACVEYIGEGAFASNLSLLSINVDENNNNYCSDSYGVLFDKNKTILIQYPVKSKTKEYIVPSSVTTIGQGAFQYGMYLEKVVMPEGLKTIEDFAFFYCYSLASVNFPEGLKSIGFQAFLMCFGLTEITLPASLVSMGECAIVDSPFLDKVYIKSMNTTFDEFAVGASEFTVEGISQEEFIDIMLQSNENNDESYADYIKEINEEDGFMRATIYCHAGSTAEAYAKTNNATYVLTHFYEGDWTYDYDNAIRYRKCINCDMIETQTIENEPQNDDSFFARIIAFFKSIFDMIKGWFS